MVAAVLWVASSNGWAGRDVLLGVSVVLGTVRAFQMPGQQALPPSLVLAIVLPAHWLSAQQACRASSLPGLPSAAPFTWPVLQPRPPMPLARCYFQAPACCAG